MRSLRTRSAVARPVSSSHRRRGTLYAGVMMTATIVAMIGLSGLSVAHLGVRAVQRSKDADNAALLARSAIEECVRRIVDNNNWRTDFANNTEYPSPPLALNGGTISWRLVDVDGSLSNNKADGVRIYGIGRAGGATYVESVLLLPADAGLTCLEAAYHSAGSVSVNASNTITTNQFLSSNSAVNATALLAKIAGGAQAVTTVSGNVTGTKKNGMTPRKMPGNAVFDYYLANGTWIDIDTIPKVLLQNKISGQVLSPSLNPFSTTRNAEGIYVIDCQGQPLVIENSRILGTLVILNPGSTCIIQNSVRWDPVSPNYPALMVRGDAQFATSQAALDEGLLATNFNPPGAPYNGSSNGTKTDQFPSSIKGLVYVSGEFRLTLNLATPLFEGSVVSGSFVNDLTASAKFNYRPTHFNYPPPGFSTGDDQKLMRIVPGTWQRSALP